MELKINTRETTTLKNAVVNIDFFNEVDFTLKYDSVASIFAFKFYFDARNQDHAELACVSHYHEAYIEHNGQRLLTGYILSNGFTSTSKKELVTIAGYSKTGVLEDCEIPISCYPLETNGLSLKEIAQKLIAPFGLSLRVDSSVRDDASLTFQSSEPVVENGIIISENSSAIAIPNTDISTKLDKKIEKANAKESKNIRQYLMELATQRNILLSHDNKGNLLFTEAHTNKKPLMYFDVPNGGMIGTTMTLTFDGQQMHSHITVVRQAGIDGGNVDEKATIRNPYVPILYRPRVISQSAGEDITTAETAQNALAAELKGIVVTIVTDRWELDGKVIEPNNIISVRNPDIYLYNKVDLFIESINYRGDSKKLIATLTCVLPECYNKKTPKNIFVSPHENLPRF